MKRKIHRLDIVYLYLSTDLTKVKEFDTFTTLCGRFVSRDFVTKEDKKVTCGTCLNMIPAATRWIKISC